MSNVSILFIHLQGYCNLIFFTLDSSAQLIVSRRCWDFAPASDEVFKQKLFRFSLQWHHCSQWEISKQLCWPLFWSDATESRKGTVGFLLVEMQCTMSIGVKLMGLFWSLLQFLYVSSEIQVENKQNKLTTDFYI